MIQKLRRIVAFTISVFLIMISLGMYKPNFSAKATVSEPTHAATSAISLNAEEDHSLKGEAYRPPATKVNRFDGDSIVDEPVKSQT